MRTRRWALTLAVLALLVAVSAATGRRTVHDGAAAASRCSDARYSATREPSNPLELPRAPGQDPLSGARLFVDGPAHGEAAGAIAQLLGVVPASFPDSYSWARFKRDLQRGPLHARLAHDPTLAREVALLEKIGDQPEQERLSLYSEGGGAGAVFDETQKILCDFLTADPGAIPILTTYFLYQDGYCETLPEILAHRPTFERQVNEFARGIGRRPAVALLELDAIGSSSCMTGATLAAWEQDIGYEIDKVSALPHTVVYIEGGYSDAESAAYTARVLNAVRVGRIRGFYTNDTHLNWTTSEIRWAERVSELTHGAHFIVNTADNGVGPLRNRDPATEGNENLCNPPGRGAGPRPTTHAGFPHVDAFLWVHVPGESSGGCNGGTPAGTFFLERTLVEAANANGKLGPGYPSHPY